MSYIYFMSEAGHILELNKDNGVVSKYLPIIPSEIVQVIAKQKGKESPSSKQKPTKKVRKCKSCGEAGHRSDNCKFGEDDDMVFTKDTIKMVMEMKHDGMRTVEQIAEETELSVDDVKKILGKKR